MPQKKPKSVFVCLFGPPRRPSQSILQAAAHLPGSGAQPAGGGEGHPTGAAQPRRGRTELLHPERPLSRAGEL